MGFKDPVVGGVVLRRPAIASPDYEPGAEGWSVNQDGTAEFNDLVIRGSFFGNDFILSSAGLFVYAGTPQFGNLILAMTNGPGSDEFSNEYSGPGISLSPPGGPASRIQIRPDLSAMLFYA